MFCGNESYDTALEKNMVGVGFFLQLKPLRSNLSGRVQIEFFFVCVCVLKTVANSSSN